VQVFLLVCWLVWHIFVDLWLARVLPSRSHPRNRLRAFFLCIFYTKLTLLYGQEFLLYFCTWREEKRGKNKETQNERDSVQVLLVFFGERYTLRTFTNKKMEMDNAKALNNRNNNNKGRQQLQGHAHSTAPAPAYASIDIFIFDL